MSTTTHTPHSVMSTTTTTTPSSIALAPARPGRSYDAYPIHIPREVSPGLMSDGTLSASHPLVQRFLAHTTRKFLDTEARAASAGKHKDKRWHGAHKHPLVTRWRCMHGGGGRVADVHDALGPGVTDRLAGAIFALGALSVYSYWARPAHWAFWAVNIVEETAAVVHEVVRADPKVIHVPDEVAWVDAEMAVNVLRVWHGGFVPRQKKKKPAASDATEDSDNKTKNANGKRSAPDDGPPSPPKKQRTKEKKSLRPTRQSARIRKCVQEDPAPSSTPDAVSTPPPATAKPLANEPEDIIVDVESTEPAATVEEAKGEAEEAPVAQSAKKPRSRPARTRKSTAGRKRKVVRTPRVSSGNTPSAEQQLPPAPSSPASPGTIRIPARSTPPSASPCLAARKLLDAATASPPPGSGESTAAASRESTAVGTPCSGLSTRVGTPQPEFEVKVEPVAMKAEVVREVPTPVRSSARIRAKSLRVVSQR